MKSATRPKTLLCSECFFGLHFDFHATADNEPIGGRPFAKDLARLLREVTPDYVQCDCKGHPGIASYPTEVGTPAPVFEDDALRVWREETSKAGVGLFMHFSGVWDTAALAKHPECARGRADDRPPDAKQVLNCRRASWLQRGFRELCR